MRQDIPFTHHAARAGGGKVPLAALTTLSIFQERLIKKIVNGNKCHLKF